MTQRIVSGIYKGRGIAGSEQYGTTSNGNEQIVLDLFLHEIGEKVSTFLVFSEKSADICIKKLRGLGWSGTDLSDLSGIDQNEVDVEIKYELYNGQERMKVQILTGAGGVVLKAPLGEREKRAFAAKFAAIAKSTPVVKGPATKAASVPAPSSSDPTIPF